MSVFVAMSRLGEHLHFDDVRHYVDDHRDFLTSRHLWHMVRVVLLAAIILLFLIFSRRAKGDFETYSTILSCFETASTNTVCELSEAGNSGR
ncbi:hypothetical protein STSP2_03112 [Anaerohalosphaera lusitana]|uniref:Uncharacterized protein n=1 Tax=Anaerohalosphaera lusitana TaxID=1936003 RepID=A0A1U9NPP9_9BACT|nr:hypothetical protein [Anaerohalosphaera lusitana]AQT69912.1 hypothetical protein STSP2_03112 [Anaerohalosphaera lusitana]